MNSALTANTREALNQSAKLSKGNLFMIARFNSSENN